MWRASSRRFVQACIGLCVMVSLTACGGKGGGSGSDVGALLGYKFSEGTKTAPISLGDVQEGGVAQRAKATVGAGGNGTPANPANSFYTVAGITAGVEYVVTLANASDDVTLFLFQGDPTFTNVSANRTTDQSKISFVAPADSDVTSYFISVSGTDTAKGAEYDLSVLVKPQSEGTAASPVEIGDITGGGYTPIFRSGSAVAFSSDCCGIQPTGDSYYHVVTDFQDVLITVSDMTDDVDLYVYDSNGILNNLVCASTKSGTAVEPCLITNMSSGYDSEYYIAIDGHNAPLGAAFRINVIQAPIGTGFCQTYLDWDTSEANLLLAYTGDTDICYMEAFPSIRTPDNSQNFTTVLSGGTPGIRPIDPMSPPAAGTVKNPATGSMDSYYWFNGLEPGKRYRLSLEEATDNAQLYVYDRDASYSTPVCTPTDYANSKVQACVFEATSTVVYAAVDGYYTVRGAAYTLQLMPEFKADGTLAVPTDLGSAPVAASLDVDNIHTVLKDGDIGISGDGDSYYKVTVTPNTQYFVSIPGMSDDVDLYVFGDDATFTNLQCAPYLGGTAAETCVINTGPSQTTLYLAVDGYFTKDGAAFLLSVVSGSGGGEGTTSTPGDLPVDLGSAPVNYSGFAIGTGLEEGPSGFDPDIVDDLQDSFYRVTVNTDSSYRVALEGVDADVDLFVFSDPGLAEVDLICSSRAVGAVGEECIASTTGISTLYIVVDGSWADAGAVATYHLKVEERVPPTPDPVTVGVPVTGELIAWASDTGIGGPNDRYYSVDLPGAGTYRIQISNLTDDLDLYVYGTDNTFQNAISCDNTYLYGTATESCAVTVGSASTVYFAVDGAWMYLDYTATYDVSVTGP